MKEKILFVINPVSGKKSKDGLPDLIKQTFVEDRYQIKIVYTSNSGEATGIVKQYFNQGYKKVVAVGGDGTVNEVASALTETDGVLGIVPTGSGNGLARHLKIPMNISKALSMLKDGRQIKIDFGTINDQKFFCTTGVGFDAHIGHVFSKAHTRGFVSYLKATLSEFKHYQSVRYEISMNGTTYMRDAFLITFANASQYGNNAHIAPKAKINDGKLDVSIMRSFPIISAPNLGTRLFMKNIDKSHFVETFQCKKIVVKRKEPGIIHYDGEPAEMGEVLNIKVVPNGLNVIVP
ncbi:MAG: diacylglycerol kinase family lipid kinase [Bacteroidota bacterium]|nr:diacylglycerol kinase family lipid kinase [Bacteroidota bacterium]